MASKPVQQLSLFDSTCLIVGIIIGVGIYQMAPEIARGAGGGWGVAGLWALGGLISLGGALCYAELATAYPQAGGDYVYLSRAYGSWAGFLFGWAQLAIVRPGRHRGDGLCVRDLRARDLRSAGRHRVPVRAGGVCRHRDDRC